MTKKVAIKDSSNVEKRLQKLEKLCKELKRLANISEEGEAELYESKN